MPTFGPIVLTIGLLTFVYSTILGWSYYGERAAEYLGRRRSSPTASSGSSPSIGIGGHARLRGDFSDLANGLMAVPNLIALLLLSNVVAAETRRDPTSGRPRRPRRLRRRSAVAGPRRHLSMPGPPQAPRRTRSRLATPPAGTIATSLRLDYVETGSARWLWIAFALFPLALICDVLDGYVARVLDTGHRLVLGGDLDSLADVISFGVAPAVLGLPPSGCAAPGTC